MYLWGVFFIAFGLLLSYFLCLGETVKKNP